MYKTILVPATGLPTDAPVHATALLAARMADAHLQFLHVRVSVMDMLVAMSTSAGSAAVVQEAVDDLEKEAGAQEDRARAAVDAFRAANGIAAAGPGVSAEFIVETGPAGEWLAEHGRFADLIVAGRPGEGGELALEQLEAALMDTGRPLLIAPAHAPAALAETVAIAWKDTPEAARAVSDALPFIRQAQRVLILAVSEGEEEPHESCNRLKKALSWHNTSTELRLLTRGSEPAVETLLSVAHEEGAGLLVMGGYSHSRLREIVFGGFTKRILREAELPVLMAH